LNKFIYYTKKSKYFIEKLEVHGPGEPTLWKNFNEGIKILHKSNVIGKIIVTSNGKSLDRIHNETWNYIDYINVSCYPDVELNFKKYKSMINILEQGEFKRIPQRRYENTIPCQCACYGPMFLKDKIFFYCGPPVFDAANLMGVNINKDTDLFVPLELNYLDKFKKENIGNLKYCEYCWANMNIITGLEEHTQKIN
ncbi:hypothetical protein ACFL1N_17295, partial [Thermodesulfobacteriota bacterium]